MLQLIKIADGRFVVHSSYDNLLSLGNLEDAIETLELMDVHADEVDAALHQMTLKGHNNAYFGVNKTFIYSERCTPIALDKVAA